MARKGQMGMASMAWNLSIWPPQVSPQPTDDPRVDTKTSRKIERRRKKRAENKCEIEAKRSDKRPSEVYSVPVLPRDGAVQNGFHRSCRPERSLDGSVLNYRRKQCSKKKY